MTIKIGVLAPYQGLRDIAWSEAENIDHIEIEAVVGEMMEAVQPAIEMEQKGIEVLISRGGTADTIRDYVSIPVIDIEVSGYDILRILTLIKDSNEKITLIGFASVCHGVMEVSKLLNIDIPYTTVDSSREVGQAVQEAVDHGFNTILGDAVSMKYIEQFGVRGIMITSGQEAVHQSLIRAKEIAQAISETRQEIYSYQSLFKTSPEGIIVFNAQGKIEFTNHAFHSLFQLHSPIEYISEMDSKYEGIFSKTIGYPFTQQHLKQKGKNILLEGSAFLKGDHPHYIVKCIDESLYSLESERFSIQSLRSDIKSFSQLCESDKQLNHIIQRCRHNINNPTVILKGRPGTGKKSLVSAMHYERNGYIRDQWEILMSSHLKEDEINHLQEMIGHSSGTFYIKGWENLDKKHMNRLIKSSLESSALSVFVTEETTTAERVHWKHLHSCLTVFLPSLQDRIEYLEEYARKFISRYNNLFGKQVVGITEHLLHNWQEKQWTKNLSELRELIKTGVYFSEEPYLKEQDVQGEREDRKPKENLDIDLSKTLTEIEEEIILKVVKEENYNQTRAAQRLGINRATLWRRLKNAE
ncbi:PAS domain-containing protein [Salibacterium salarium]|uniref:PAS domain-containing protein n=1 Tax=Salibacterium salarium TaxID=284579 RepID=A0A428MZ84_9BACI|nr:PrpR N-terminal domain-containing protein [Salibacterium salarium]RSL31422.1 PAS domain-containing protein [Salibacterium salarium]